ncbi:gliding motility-associated C-terminal domain-containing protein [Formosa sp. L2A11]|uniref:gliding motility-associated C-terminal domain-containing protein n=1 Tax=Formosa sp. L2A11 TaxID=2686363 RepID=UPI00131A89BB|nr:gliding motility-associated C-terminal domain-containing protein [Formosa sp. L2A11]
MKKPLLHICFLLCVTSGIIAQTSNDGVLYISENTQFSTVSGFNNLSQGTFNNDGESFIYSDFNNDGVVDFYEDTGITQFVGSENQYISGSQVSYLYNVVFSNGSNDNPFHLSGEINVSGIVDFDEGIVDNDNFGGEFTFNIYGNHINTSDISYVDGFVNKLGDEEFVFPIGDQGHYRLAGISAPIESNDFFKIKYYYENSNALYSHDLKADNIMEIDPEEYWDVQNVTDSPRGLITLSWREYSMTGGLMDAVENEELSIVRWDESSNMWIDEGGVIDFDDQTITTAVSGYGIFTFARLETERLPCSLEVYNYVSPNGDGKNDYFAIEKTDDSCVRELNVQIFNRWGVKVYEMSNYGENGRVFDGHSSGRLTVKDSDKLPANTYYYILKYKYGSEQENNSHKEAGFLYLSDN